MVPLIETRALCRVDESGHTLLPSTDFQLRGHQRVVIVGTSGAGKSVLLRALAWLDAPSGGELLWQGQALVPAQIPHYRSQVCYLAQRPALLPGSVEDNLRFPFTLNAFKQRRFEPQVVDTLLAMAGKTSAFLAKNALDLSGGEAQIVALIRTLQLKPQVLLLDEPTSSLDTDSVRAVETMVDRWFTADVQMAPAYIWVSHDRQQAARIGSKVLQMSAGTLVEITP